MPLDIRDRVTDEETASLLKRVPGEVALEILAAMQEKNLIVWYNTSRWATTVEFFSTNTMEKVQQLDSVKMARAKDALVALFKRRYIAQVNQTEVVHNLNEIMKKKKGVPFSAGAQLGLLQRKDVQKVPWYSTAEIFLITETGRQALTGIQGKLRKIRTNQRNLEENPKFVVSARVTREGEKIPGVGQIYYLVKETSSRVIVKKPEQSDGVLYTNERDHALLTEGSSYKNNQYLYLEKHNVIMMDTNPQQWAQLKAANDLFDQQVATARKEMEQLIEPIKARFRDKYVESGDAINRMIKNFTQANKDRKNTEIEEEEVISIGLDEIQAGLKM